jgi:hypothetical protein
MGRTASALVVDVIQRTPPGSRTGFEMPLSYPVVEFTLPDGSTVRAESMMSATPAFLWLHKRPVTVIYDPANPQRVYLQRATASPSLPGVVMICLGWLMCVLATFTLAMTVLIAMFVGIR